MKNKRMKLTALAMSVLMAMSTITSVTWAADLFTDGTPAEVVETSDDFVSDVEEQVVADDAALTGVSADDLTSVVFKYDTSDVDNATKVMAKFTFTTGLEKEVEAEVAQIYRTGNCERPDEAIYEATVGVDGGTITKYSNDGDIVIDVNTDYTLNSDSKDEFGNPVKVYNPLAVAWRGQLIVPGSRFAGEHTPNGRSERVIRAASCTQVGKKALYNSCSNCGAMLVTGGNVAVPMPGDFSWSNYVNLADGATVSVGGCIITIRDIPVNDHTYDKANPKPVTGAYITAIKNKFGVNSTESAYVDSLAPVNCQWDPSGKMVVIDDTQDAFYYTVYECKNCGSPIQAEKVYLKDVTGVAEGTYYEAGDNIRGFLRVNPTTGKLDISAPRVKKEAVLHKANGEPIPVMQNGCTKVGYYNVAVYQWAGNPGVSALQRVSSELKEIRGDHAWGSTEVAPNGTPIDASGTLSQTENDQLLRDNTITDPDNPQQFVVVRDAQGNVTEAKSKNCVTKAKYQLYHICLVCGAVEKVGDLKTTDVNSDIHQWGNWAPNVDDSDSDYINKGDYHEKYTYQHRTCDLCGKRDLRLFEKIQESHTLTETKVEGGEEKEPTCGEAGYYTVQLQCPCGYADTNSTKKTTIPPTDAHDFGDNEAEMVVVGNIQIGGRTATERESTDPTHIVYGTIVRKCNVCGQYDSNGIGNTKVGQPENLFNGNGIFMAQLPAVGGTEFVNDLNTASGEKTLSDYVPAKADPTTGVPYSCSVGKITVTLKWAGKVDGSPKMLEKKVTVPYYPTELAYAGARAHDPAEAKIENKVDATAETAGSYDKVIYCRVCGDEISRETITVDPETIIPAPTAKATPVNYNTINITWNAVEGATSYDVYYRSAALGVNDWTLAKKVTGTSFDYSGLITGVKYRFTVSAVAGENSSEFGVNTSVATPKLAAPEIKTVTAVKKGTKVTWTKVDGASGYIIQRKTSSGKWTRVGTVKKGAKVSWTDKKAVSGSKYRVRAYRTVEAANISKNNVYGPVSAEK